MENKKQRITGTSNSNIPPEIKTETCCSCSLLPFDIVADILSRLPAKSLAKFRCVCKQWLSLTYEPRFLKSQHARSSRYMIINRRVLSGEIRLYDFSIGDGRKPTDSFYTLDLGRKHYKLSNFVDGLTCAYGSASSNIYLLNPMTRELQKLRGNSIRRQEGRCDESFGLGFDMTMEQYKIVRLFARYPGHIHCQIHTVGTARWRRLGEAPFVSYYRSNPVLLNGALHWIGYVTRGDHQEDKRCLFKFDIKDEKFGSAICIPSPSFSNEPPLCLREFGGKLWVTFWNRFENYFEIWTTKDYLKDTWAKEYKFHSRSLSSLEVDFHAAEIIDGEVLIKFYEGGKWLVLRYSPRTGAFSKHFDERDFAIYRESLISPMKPSQRCTKKGGSK